MRDEQNYTELTEASNDLLDYAHELTYLAEHFIRKSNKSTSLELRNHLRESKNIILRFRNASVRFFKETGTVPDGDEK